MTTRFSQLTNVDMKFGALVDVDGREKPLTQSTYSSFLLKRDRGLRERAFKQFYDEFQDHRFTLASALSYSVKADVFRARARNFSSALEASLFKDDVPVAVYDGLIKAVREGIPALLRYFRAEAAGSRSRRASFLRHLRPVSSRNRNPHQLSTKRSTKSSLRLRRSAMNTRMRWPMACAVAGAIVTRQRENAVAPSPPAATTRRRIS